MKTQEIGAAVALVFICSSIALAQPDETTRKMLEEVASKTAAITSYRVDLRMEMRMMGQPTITNSEMAFKMPGKMHMKNTSDMMGGMTQEIFKSGDIVWTYMPVMKMVTKMDMTRIKSEIPQQSAAASQGDITKPFQDFPKDGIKYIEKKKVDGGQVYVFEAKPDLSGKMPPGQPTPQMLPNKIIFWIDTDTGLPAKVTMLAEDGSTMMDQIYSNFRINVEIDDSEFEFTPPEGVQVMDMTEGTINMMKQMQGSQP